MDFHATILARNRRTSGILQGGESAASTGEILTNYDNEKCRFPFCSEKANSISEYGIPLCYTHYNIWHEEKDLDMMLGESE